MATHSNVDVFLHDPVVYIFVLVIVSLSIRNIHGLRQRTSELRQLAASRGLNYLGKIQPVPLAGTEALRDGRAWRHAAIGRIGGREVAMMDCTIGYWNRPPLLRTILAMKGQSRRRRETEGLPGLSVEEAEGWTLIYAPGRLMLIEEIDSILSALDAPS